MTQITQYALNLPAANVCSAYIVQANFAIKEVEITPFEFEQLRRDLPVTYSEPGYISFDVEAQLEAEREYQHQCTLDEIASMNDELAGTGRM
jgi:hypothetical protein